MGQIPIMDRLKSRVVATVDMSGEVIVPLQRIALPRNVQNRAFVVLSIRQVHMDDVLSDDDLGQHVGLSFHVRVHRILRDRLAFVTGAAGTKARQ